MMGRKAKFRKNMWMTPLIYPAPVVNTAITPDEMLAILCVHLPDWRWQTKFERHMVFQITGRHGWRRMHIDRRPNGTIFYHHQISLLWSWLTLGVAYFVGHWSGVGYSQVVERVLRDHVHVAA